jgi:formate hydrogenlyase subunit 4
MGPADRAGGGALMATVAASLLQILFLLALAPGLNGVVKAAKARLQSRQGPPIVQGYYDLAKWLRKGTAYSSRASWISHVAPVVAFAATLAAGLLVPTLLREAPLGGSGELLALVYLFALARFATALAGLDAGGAFGGMGSSREMAISALAEPVLLLAFFVLIVQAGSSAIGRIVAAGPALTSVGGVLAFAALYVVTLAETGRIPVDNPDTHLELTMVHEGMILEAAGPNLALYHWGAMVKQVLLLSLLANVFIPWGLAADATDLGAVAVSTLVYLLKLGLLALALAVTESGMAKLRIFRVPDLMGTAFALALLGLAAEAMIHA